MARRILLLVPAVAIVGVVVAYLAGAFDEEKTFTAEEFVAAANEEGATMTLGAALVAPGQTHEIYDLELSGEEEHDAEDGDADEEGEGGHAHDAASLVVTENADAAVAEFRRCEGAISFVCYRAANITLRVESEDPAQLAQLNAVFTALGTG